MNLTNKGKMKKIMGNRKEIEMAGEREQAGEGRQGRDGDGVKKFFYTNQNKK